MTKSTLSSLHEAIQALRDEQAKSAKEFLGAGLKSREELAKFLGDFGDSLGDLLDAACPALKAASPNPLWEKGKEGIEFSAPVKEGLARLASAVPLVSVGDFLSYAQTRQRSADRAKAETAKLDAELAGWFPQMKKAQAEHDAARKERLALANPKSRSHDAASALRGILRKAWNGQNDWGGDARMSERQRSQLGHWLDKVSKAIEGGMDAQQATRAFCPELIEQFAPAKTYGFFETMFSADKRQEKRMLEHWQSAFGSWEKAWPETVEELSRLIAFNSAQKKELAAEEVSKKLTETVAGVNAEIAVQKKHAVDEAGLKAKARLFAMGECFLGNWKGISETGKIYLPEYSKALACAQKLGLTGIADAIERSKTQARIAKSMVERLENEGAGAHRRADSSDHQAQKIYTAMRKAGRSKKVEASATQIEEMAKMERARIGSWKSASKQTNASLNSLPRQRTPAGASGFEGGSSAAWYPSASSNNNGMGFFEMWFWMNMFNSNNASASSLALQDTGPHPAALAASAIKGDDAQSFLKDFDLGPNLSDAQKADWAPILSGIEDSVKSFDLGSPTLQGIGDIDTGGVSGAIPDSWSSAVDSIQSAVDTAASACSSGSSSSSSSCSSGSSSSCSSGSSSCGGGGGGCSS